MVNKRISDDIKLGAVYGADWPNGSIPRPDPTRGPVFVSHEESLRRDLEIINARTVAELGPLPPGGLPVQAKRKPELPYRPLLEPADQETGEKGAMNMNQVAAATMATAVAVTQVGCAPASLEKPKVEYRQNPAPTEKYELRMRIDDGPGPFGSIKGFMQFDVTNEICLVPPKDNWGRSSRFPYHTIPFDLKPTGDGEYVATVFTDGMIDEDYYGYGVCKWRLLNVQVSLQATGDDSETLFMADLWGEELQTGQAKKIYYWKGSYPGDPESPIENFPDSGQTNRSRMASSLTDDDVFIITMASKELMP